MSSPDTTMGDRTPVNQTRFTCVNEIRVRYADSGGAGLPTVLLTSPWPESLLAFVPIWPALSEHFRVVAVDLPGFGGSERRDALLAPEAMGDFLVRFVEELDIRPHIVGPDIGTSAALFAVAARPDLFPSVVVGSGGAAVPIDLGDPLRDWALAEDLERFRAMDARVIVDAAIDTIDGFVSQEARADYRDSYAGDRFVESMRYVRRYPVELPKLAGRLGGIETPVQIIAGKRDLVVPLVNAEFLADGLPNARLSIVDAGHFVWEDAPEEYASLIVDWVEAHG